MPSSASRATPTRETLIPWPTAAFLVDDADETQLLLATEIKNDLMNM